MNKIPKLELSYFDNNAVRCPECDYFADRFSTTKSKKYDNLNKDCPYCRMKARLKEKQKRELYELVEIIKKGEFKK